MYDQVQESLRIMVSAMAQNEPNLTFEDAFFNAVDQLDEEEWDWLYHEAEEMELQPSDLAEMRYRDVCRTAYDQGRNLA